MNRKLEAIEIAKNTFVKCRLDGSAGTSYPGQCALKQDPDLLRDLSEDISIVLVTGTNGKTTTTRMMAALLDAADMCCISNRYGANMTSGIATALALNTDDQGRLTKKYAVFECDEKYLKTMCRTLKPKVVVITNISKDQVARYHSPENVCSFLTEALMDTDAAVCLNRDNTYCSKIGSVLLPERITYYSGAVGRITCGRSGYPVVSGIPGDYNYQNAAAAFAGFYLMQALAGSPGNRNCAAVMQDVFRTFKLPFGRMESFPFGKHKATMNLAKNPEGLKETLRYIESLPEKPLVVFGFHAAEEDDSRDWIEEIDFSVHKTILEQSVVFGECADITFLMLQKAGVSPVFAADYHQLMSILKSAECNIFLVLNYTCMMQVRQKLADEKYVKNYWET